MTQNKSNIIINQLFVVLLTGIVTTVVFVPAMLTLPKPDDGIPWAQNMPEISTPPQDVLHRFIRTFLVVTATNILIWGYCKLRNIQKLSLLVITMITASASGLLFSALPVAYDAVWSIIIKFHLKQPEQYLNLVVTVLYSVLTIGVGTSIGFLVLSLVNGTSREKRQVKP